MSGPPPPLTPGSGGPGLGNNLSFKMPARPGSSLRKARQSASDANQQSAPSTPGPAVSFKHPNLPLPSPLHFAGGSVGVSPSSAGSPLPANPFDDAALTSSNAASPFTPLGHRRGNSRSSDILLAAAAGSAGGHNQQQQHPSRPQSPSSSSVEHDNIFDTTVMLSSSVAHALSATSQGRQQLADLREGLEKQTHAAAALGASLMEHIKRIDQMMDNLNQEMHTLQSRSGGSADTTATSESSASVPADKIKDDDGDATLEADQLTDKDREAQADFRRKMADIQTSIRDEVTEMETTRLELVKSLLESGPKTSPAPGIPASASIHDILAGLNVNGMTASRSGDTAPDESPSKNAAAAAAAAYDFLNSDPHSFTASRSTGANTSLASLLAVSPNANGSAASGPGGPTARQSDRRARNAVARSSITDQNLVNQLQEGLVSEIRRLQSLLGERDTELAAVRAQKEDSEKEAALWKPKALQLIENEDALKQENWDLSVAKQTLAEQLAEAQATLRKAEAEKTRLNRDVTKARENLDSQRAEIEAQTTELDRLKNLRETEAALARKERAGLQRDYSNLQTELQHLRAEGKRTGMSISGMGGAGLGAGARSISNSMLSGDDSSRVGDVSMPIPEEDDRAGGRNLLEPGSQGGAGGMSPSTSIFSEMPADRSGAQGTSVSGLLNPGAVASSKDRAGDTDATTASTAPAPGAAAGSNVADDLRVRLARAHQKSIRDQAERRKQRDLIAQLTRELQEAGVKLSASLEGAVLAASAEPSEDEAAGDSIWLDEAGNDVSRSRSHRVRTMPRSSTRPSIASRLGLGAASKDSSGVDDQLSDDEDEADEIAELGDEHQQSRTSASGEASTARAESSGATVDADLTSSPKKPRVAAPPRARPLSTVSNSASSGAVAETLGDALASAPTKDLGRKLAHDSTDTGPKASSLLEAGAQTDELEDEEVWEQAEEEPKTMLESQSMTDPIDVDAALRAALSERDAEHARVLSRLEIEHRSKLEELLRTHDGVLDSRDANHKRALEGRDNEHTKAVEALRDEHAKALADADAAHRIALANARAEHDKALVDARASSEKAMSDAQAAHEQILATEIKTATDKTLEQARAHQESALAEARSRHSKALAEQVAAGSTALAAAQAQHTQVLTERDLSHKADIKKLQEAHAEELRKRASEAEARAAVAQQKLLEQRDQEHAEAKVELKVAHSKLIREKDTAQLAALAERDEAFKKARSEIDALQQKLTELTAEVERLRKEADLAKAAHAEAVAYAAAAATAAAQAAAQAAAADGSDPAEVSVSAKDLEEKLRPLSMISDDSNVRASSMSTDMESSDAFTDAEDHLTPARTPTPGQSSTDTGTGLRGRVAAGVAAAVGLSGIAASVPRSRKGDADSEAQAREEPGVKRVVLAELQDESCQTDGHIWEAYKAELRAEGAAQANSTLMNSSSTITGLDGTAAGVLLVGSAQKLWKNRDSMSTFGGGNNEDAESSAPTATPSLYSVGAVLGSSVAAPNVARQSMDSSITGPDSAASTNGKRLDKTKPPHMQVPPPPAMPPPPGLTGRRSQPSPVLAGVPPRPTSPPPPELLSRVQQQQRSTLQVPSGGSRPSTSGIVAPSGAPATSGLSGHPLGVPRQSSSSNLRTRKQSNESALAAGAAANGDHLSAHSRRSRRAKVPRKTSQTSFASDVTSELSRRISFGSSRQSDALADRTEPHAQAGNGTHHRAATRTSAAPDGTDPDIIQAITQTMIGEYLFKYTRKTMRAGYSDKRHKRFFWVHPYTRMLYWTINDPGGARIGDGSSKGAAIEDVRVVEDTNPNPPGIFHMSIIVKTAAREMKLTAPNKDRHDVWLAALGYLVNRGMPGSDATSMGDGGALTDQENRSEFGNSPRQARDRSATVGTANSRSRFFSPARSLRSRKSNDAFMLYAANKGGHSDVEANDTTPRPRNGSIGPNSTLNLSSTKRAGLPAREYLEHVESDTAARRAAAQQRALLPARSHLRPRYTGGDQFGPQTPGGKMSIGSAFGIPGSAGVVVAQNQSPGPAADDSWDQLGDLSAHSFNDPRLKTAEEMIVEDNAGFEGLVNVRACCDGKHDVGSLAHRHHD